MREKSLQMNTTVNEFEDTISNGYNLNNNNNSTFISPIYAFPWRET